MSINSELLVRTGQFLNDQIDFLDLVEWVEDREPHWASLPRDSVARILAGTIMLAAYEVDDGSRDPSSVKELLAEAPLQKASA